LTPAEITQLRERLGLSKKDFAHLLGVSLRSIHHWENPERKTPPSRGSDLMMKIVQQSLDRGPVDAIELLLEEAKKWGVTIQLDQGEMAAQN
jgi:transcriptional regulator with XRE-family HTH domain